MSRTKEFDTEEVLDKAITLFWDKGYNACSIQDVVDGLGLSRSSIYETFGDKRQLFLAALKKYQVAGMDALRREMENSTDIRQSITRLFESILPCNLKDPLQKGCFMVNTGIELAPHDPEIAELITKNRRETEETLAAAIRRGQENGQLSTRQDPMSVARYIYVNLSGLRVTSSSGVFDTEAMEQIIRVALSVL